MQRLRLCDLQRIIKTVPRIVLLGSDDRRIAALFLAAPLIMITEGGGTIITTQQRVRLWNHYVICDCMDDEGRYRYGPYRITTPESGLVEGRVAIIDTGVSADQVVDQIVGMDYVIALDPTHTTDLGYPEFHIADIGGNKIKKEKRK